jgi:predicted enzyme related to lactoylglutathione lyase
MAAPNHHVWYELITTDQDAAEAFYADVAGWSLADSGMPGMRYTIISAGEHRIGGIMAMENGPPPIWMGYVGVDDVDAFAARVKELGGAVHKAPEDIPGVGRFSVVTDPQGAVFVLFKGTPSPDMPAPERPPYMAPGTIGWNELHTTDWKAAFDFYAQLFGWAKDEAMDMGEMGTYQLIRTGADHAEGAMFDSPQMPQPVWLYYVSVPDIDAAKAKVEAGGGNVLSQPMEVPGGMWVFQATDPQGAMFALVGQRA